MNNIEDTGDTTVITPPPHPPDTLQHTNVIVILADDMGYEIPRYTGGQSYNTPNIDELAHGGMQFTQCRASPLCSPSRFMLMTGKYNCRNYSVWGHMDTTEYTIANMMRDAGYKTCMAGKWQFDGGGAAIKALGFDFYRTTNPYLKGTAGYESEQFYKDPNVYENGDYWPLDSTAGLFGEDLNRQYVTQFITYNRNNPFFVYWAPHLIHKPYTATPDDDDFNSFVRNHGDSTYFRSMVEYLDKEIGLVIDTINKLGIANNTLILFAGDNGTEQITSKWNNTYVKGEKSHTVEWGIHVPMIAYLPGTIAAGSTNDNLVDFTDFFTTIADFEHIKRPAKLDGHNFLNGKPRDWTYCYYDANNPEEESEKKPKEWAQDKDYKLYNNEKLYKYSADVHEEKNLLLDSLSAEAQIEYNKLKPVLDLYNK